MMEAAVSPGESIPDTAKKTEPRPEFYLYFLKVEGAPSNWIRIDQVTHVRAVPIRVKEDVILPEPCGYKITVWTISSHSWTVMEVPTKDQADDLVDRILVEVSMRLSNLYHRG